MRLPSALVALAGCGANIVSAGGLDDAAIDSSGRDAARADAAVDAALDARLCAGGDMHATAPDGSCLVMFSTPMSFSEATTTCTGLGAHLAILLTPQIDMAAEMLVGNLDTFIGLTDQVSEGHFVWVDGTPLSYTNWEVGEPNNGGGGGNPENCAIIAGARAAKGWDDRPCAQVVGSTAGRYAALCHY